MLWNISFYLIGDCALCCGVGGAGWLVFIFQNDNIIMRSSELDLVPGRHGAL